jgi:transposase-like protein
MRYPASEKLEIIRLVEQSHLPVKRTLAMLGIPRTTFYRWYDRYLSLGQAGSRIAPRARAGSGTVSLTLSAGRSSIGARRA